MNLNSLLRAKGIDPEDVIVMRHRPNEPELNKVLPWLAAERPETFNAYQATQGQRVEKAMKELVGRGFIASFIGVEPGKALFVGLYAIGKPRSLNLSQYWKVPAYGEMKSFGMRGFTGEKRTSVLWFDLKLQEVLASWKGKLVVEWPPPGRSWWRRAHRNEMPVLAIHAESQLEPATPRWDETVLSWNELKILPGRLKAKLSEWRGVYYIYDSSDGLGYVGSASGSENLLGRWRGYAKSGHGGNRLLKRRDPSNFCFSILQRVSPDMTESEIIKVENGWKRRLHTLAPEGLNDN